MTHPSRTEALEAALRETLAMLRHVWNCTSLPGFIALPDVMRQAEAALALPPEPEAAPRQAPPGWVLAPEEATDAMVDATYHGQPLQDIWRDMLAARPAPDAVRSQTPERAALVELIAECERTNAEAVKRLNVHLVRYAALDAARKGLGEEVVSFCGGHRHILERGFLQDPPTLEWEPPPEREAQQAGEQG